MKKSIKLITYVSIVAIVSLLNWNYLKYAYNWAFHNPKVVILPFIENGHYSYNSSLKQERLLGKPSLVIMINDDWMKEFVVDKNHLKLLDNCTENGWNLVYLSNEYGSGRLNRVDWLNDICSNNVYGYHIYANDALIEWSQYTKIETDSRSAPYALLTDSNGSITDTVYNYNDIVPQKLIENVKYIK